MWKGRSRRIGDLGPLAIEHVDLDAGASTGGTTSSALVVFWSSGIPVGQILVQGSQGGEDIAALASAVIQAKLARIKSLQGLASGLTLSLVICTRNRPADLARCLASLAGQTYQPTEIIVVDNGSAGNQTREAAQAFGVHYIREDRTGLDIARTTGAQAAVGDIVAYTDDDVEVHPRWLERLVAAFDRPEIAAVTGLVLPACLDTPAQQIFEAHWGFGRGFERIDFDHRFYASTRNRGCPAWRIGAGANMAFRRSIFDVVGFFSTRGLMSGRRDAQGSTQKYGTGSCGRDLSAAMTRPRRWRITTAVS